MIQRKKKQREFVRHLMIHLMPTRMLPFTNFIDLVEVPIVQWEKTKNTFIDFHTHFANEVAETRTHTHTNPIRQTEIALSELNSIVQRWIDFSFIFSSADEHHVYVCARHKPRS